MTKEKLGKLLQFILQNSVNLPQIQIVHQMGKEKVNNPAITTTKMGKNINSVHRKCHANCLKICGKMFNFIHNKRSGLFLYPYENGKIPKVCVIARKSELFYTDLERYKLIHHPWRAIWQSLSKYTGLLIYLQKRIFIIYTYISKYINQKSLRMRQSESYRQVRLCFDDLTEIANFTSGINTFFMICSQLICFSENSLLLKNADN